MNKTKLPKVLVVSTNAWRDNTGINTLIEFFKCWNPESIAQIYTKSALPNTKICNNFFRISESKMIKSVFNRKIKTGDWVVNTKDDTNNSEFIDEKSRYNNTKSGSARAIMRFFRELVWKFGKWKTAELDAFIENFDADVLFIPVYPTIYMGRIQKYIIKKTGKPVVSYLADDNYTYKSISKNPFSVIKRFFLRRYIKFIVDNSNKLLVIAPKQKEEYDRIFNKNSIVMTKGIDFEEFVPYKPQIPIKMVYTGKLIIGRWKSLASIAKALEKINFNGVKAELDIYTTDLLTPEQSKALNTGSSSVKGALTLDEVKEVQSKADILVFVESLEKKYKNAARLSFSTKITDYLKSGKCIFAIGDKDIAPIDYFNKHDSAITASSYDEIEEKIKLLIDNSNLIIKYSRRAHECGIKFHNRSVTNNLLIKVINDAII